MGAYFPFDSVDVSDPAALARSFPQAAELVADLGGRYVGVDIVPEVVAAPGAEPVEQRRGVAGRRAGRAAPRRRVHGSRAARRSANARSQGRSNRTTRESLGVAAATGDPETREVAEAAGGTRTTVGPSPRSR